MLTNKTATKRPSINSRVSPDELNKHFVSVTDQVLTNDRSKTNDLTLLKTYCREKKIYHAVYIPPMKLYEVYDSLRKLKQTGTRGIDGIDGKILKLCTPIIAEPLTYIYNLCIDQNYFPETFKQTKVIPILKSGDPTDASNYRPISILPVLSKPLEKHIQKHISAHITKYQLLHPNQSGFRENHSCHTALTNMIEQLYTNMKDEQLSGILFVDFAKAFDVIDHNLLLRKLKLYNLSNSTLDMIQSFLSDRHQIVSVNTVESSFLEQKFGVPQGSILGPLLFSLYINDLPLSISNSLCEMFADDTSLQTRHSELNGVSKQLQKNVNELIDWTELNHMALNSQKTKCMLVTTYQKRHTLTSSLPPIYIGNNKIDEVKYHTILGVTIQNDLSWTIYLDKLSTRVSQKVSQLTQMKHFLNLHARKIFFFAHIQSLIDYTSTIWDNAPACAKKPLISIHKRAIKQILLRSTSLTANDYKRLGILPLKQKLILNKAVLMYKIVNKHAPQALINKCPKNEKRHIHNELDVCRKPRISLYQKSLHFSGGTLWNSLPLHLKTTKRLSSFKRVYKQYLFSRL